MFRQTVAQQISQRHDTADIAKAAKDIIDGCTFDNNLPCIAEKEVFAFANIADALVDGMRKNGAYLITKEQADALSKIVLVDKTDKKTGAVKKIVNRDCVGRDAAVLLSKIGIKVGSDIRCIYREHTGKGAEGYIPGMIAGHEPCGIIGLFLYSFSPLG